MELRTIELTKQYGFKAAVNHLNITLSSGVYGLLGANGAGKTTLMRIVICFYLKSSIPTYWKSTKPPMSD